LFEIFASVPKGSELHLAPSMDGLINFGIFKMKQPEYQSRFVELFTYALEMVSGQAGLISTHAHRSLDGWRCINFGHWQLPTVGYANDRSLHRNRCQSSVLDYFPRNARSGE
jgi:hypothetical protein